ncbi:MAG: hypothetical protein AAGE94_18870, partial [Acidobacteriota bacterium]
MQRLPIPVLMVLALSLSASGPAASASSDDPPSDRPPSVDLKLNGSSSAVVASCGLVGLTFDGSGTIGEDRYLVSIQQSDQWWR